MEHMLRGVVLTLLWLGALSTVSADAVEEQLRVTARETQKSLPMQVEPGVQATSVAAVGKTLMYRYHFTGVPPTAREVASIKADAFRNSVNSSCTNPEMVNALKQDVNFQYDFYDRDNRFVFQYTINRKACGR